MNSHNHAIFTFFVVLDYSFYVLLLFNSLWVYVCYRFSQLGFRLISSANLKLDFGLWILLPGESFLDAVHNQAVKRIVINVNLSVSRCVA